MSNQVFEAALGITSPWFVKAVDFDAPQRRLTINIDFVPGSRFAQARAPGQHPVHATQIKCERALNPPHLWASNFPQFCGGGLPPRALPVRWVGAVATHAAPLGA